MLYIVNCLRLIQQGHILKDSDCFVEKFCYKRKSDIVMLDTRKTNSFFLFCCDSRKFDIVVLGKWGKLTSLPNTDGSLGAERKRRKLSDTFYSRNFLFRKLFILMLFIPDSFYFRYLYSWKIHSRNILFKKLFNFETFYSKYFYSGNFSF